MYNRLQLFPESGHESFFLWGARQTGKSTWLQKHFPDAVIVDLLQSEVLTRYLKHPEILRDMVSATEGKTIIILDEIQKVPALLNEVHWLMNNRRDVRFIMSGSSARKILREGQNLLGGRALRYELYPFIAKEIPSFDLMRALNHGLIPRHYLTEQPKRLIAAYIGNYLRDEISAEARIRDIGVFSRFLEAAAFSNGEILNYTNIATDCGVSQPTIREYFKILEDTLVARFIPVYQKKPKRRVIQSPKFYFFDVGVANHLLKRGKIEPGSEAFGAAFEHFILNEIVGHSHYSGLDYPIHYWRTASQIEIDFVLGEHEVAIEVKGTDRVSTHNLRGITHFMEEYKVKHAILISRDPIVRKHNNIWIVPWQVFLDKLWAGEWIG